jgi:uncharacterized protein (TIGR03067 family)
MQNFNVIGSAIDWIVICGIFGFWCLLGCGCCENEVVDPERIQIDQSDPRVESDFATLKGIWWSKGGAMWGSEHCGYEGGFEFSARKLISISIAPEDGKRSKFPGILYIDPTTSPKKFDWYLDDEEGHPIGCPRKGIYKYDGDTLYLAIAYTLEKTDPKTFTPKHALRPKSWKEAEASETVNRFILHRPR